MNTGSTKPRGRNTADDQGTERGSSIASTEDIGGLNLSPLAWRVASLGIVLGAAIIRLYHLGLKPLHHDEGVNGFFLTNLFRSGLYHYDPANYHGPTLYYFALIVTKFNGLLFGQAAGLSTVAIRLVPAIFGVATVWLALCLRRNIGTLGALVAAAFISVSPGHVYISRYFIHEAQFVFFTLAIVVAVLRYYETGDPLFLLLSSLSGALLFATKETAFISVGVLGIAALIAWGYVALFSTRVEEPRGKVRRSKKKQKRDRRSQRVLQRFGGLRSVVLWSGVAVLLFIFINILFYSSFFTYWKGVSGALESLQVWAKTSTKDHTQAGVFGYLDWLKQEEAPLLIIGTMGALIALLKRRSRSAIFVAAWSFGILGAYSLIPYKTPWLMLNFIVPLAVVAGYAVNQIYSFGNETALRIAAAGIAAIALAITLTQSVVLNFYRYDDERYPYVYAHSTREVLVMLEKIEELAKRSPTGKETGITITSPDYWPLPWYLRDYDHAGFHGRLVPTTEPIVVGKDIQEGMLFREDDLTSVSGVVAKLKNRGEPVMKYLRTRLSPETVELVDGFTGSAREQQALARALADDFNSILVNGSLPMEEFSQISLRDDTLRLFENKPEGEDQLRLNRMLLEDAFPNDLAKNLPTLLGTAYRRLNSGLNPDGTYTLRPGVNLVLYAKKEMVAP